MSDAEGPAERAPSKTEGVDAGRVSGRSVLQSQMPESGGVLGGMCLAVFENSDDYWPDLPSPFFFFLRFI